MERIPLNERIAALHKYAGPPFGDLCGLTLEDYFEAIELIAGRPRRPILSERSKDWLRYRQEEGDTLAGMAAKGAAISGSTLRSQYLYNLLIAPILILEVYL